MEMNNFMLWKIKVFISLLILIEGCLCCPVITDRPIEELLEENKKTPWMVIIIDLTIDLSNKRGLNSQCYGSLIHEKLVLTSSYPIAYLKPKYLEVIANISIVSNKYFGYEKRTVLFMTRAHAIKEKEMSVNDWVILTLENPFYLNDRINVINLAESDYKFDKNCQIHHLQLVTLSYADQLDNTPSLGLWYYPYNVTLNAGKFKITEEGIGKMTEDSDCIVADCIKKDWSTGQLVRKLSFMGSPIVCPLEDGTPVQVGFSTIIYEIQGKDDDQVVRYYSGGFVSISNDKDEFLDNIINIFNGKY